MIRYVFRHLFITSILIIIAVTVALGAMYIYNDMYSWDPDDDFSGYMEIVDVVGMGNNRTAVVGNYVDISGDSKGTPFGKSFYKVYDSKGNILRKIDIGIDNANVDVCDVIAKSNGDLAIVCLVIPDDPDVDSYGTVFFVKNSGVLSSQVLLSASQAEGGYYNVVAADSQGDFFAGLGYHNTVIFNSKGDIVLNIDLVNVATVTSVKYNSDMVLLTGALAANSNLDTFTKAFFAGYDMDGEELWHYDIAPEGDRTAFVLDSFVMNDGSILLYGKYDDLSEENETGSGEGYPMEKVGRFYPYDNKIVPGIGTQLADSDMSAFWIKADKDGQVLETVFYDNTESASAPVPVGCTGDRIMMVSAYAETGTDPTYVENIFFLDSDLNEISAAKLWVDSATQMWLTCEADGSIAAYMTLGGSGKYSMNVYSSVNELSQNIKLVDQSRTIQDLYFKLRPVLGWMAIALIYFILLRFKCYWNRI